jgi:hypothetical protein
MKNTLILLILILFSCNSIKENENLCEVTNKILIKENSKYNAYLSENIKSIILKNEENLDVLKFEDLTNSYLEYLSKIDTEISKNSTEFFFENDNYSSKGKEFINKTKTYKTEIEKLVLNENLKKRINLVLNTNDIKMPENSNEIAENNETSEIKPGKIYVKYLDYYYKGFSKSQSTTFLLNKKKSILEIENEFILTKINEK